MEKLRLLSSRKLVYCLDSVEKITNQAKVSRLFQEEIIFMKFASSNDVSVRYFAHFLADSVESTRKYILQSLHFPVFI